MSTTNRGAQSPATYAGLLALALLVPRAQASMLSNRDIISPNSIFLTAAETLLTGRVDATPMFTDNYCERGYSGQSSACAGCLDLDYRFTNSESRETREQTFTEALSAGDTTARYILAYLPAAVPEPSALALLGSGLTIVALLLRRFGLKR